MHDRLNDDKRILTVTAGNLRQNHLYISKHLDFLPKDCIGPARRAGQVVPKIEIELDGLAKTIATDIGMDAKTGKPRRFIRDRAWIGKFFKHHKVQEGARLVLSRLTPRRYRLSIDLESLDQHRQLRAVEFFAGIGLVRLALEQNGTKVMLRASVIWMATFGGAMTHSRKLFPDASSASPKYWRDAVMPK